MGPYVFMKLDSIKDQRIMTAAYNHNEKRKEYEYSDNVDRSRSDRNYHIIEPGGTYTAEYKRKIKEANAVPKHNSSRLVEGIITPSREWISEMSEERQREFFAYSLKFFTNWLGTERFISAVVHMDETNPHMHFVFVPYTDDGRLSRRDLIGYGSHGMSNLQDRFHEHISEKYPEIERGISKAKTHRKVLPRYLFKSASELNERYNELYNQIQDINVFNSKEKKDQTVRLLSKYTEDYASIMYRIKTAETYIRQAEEEAKRKDRHIERLEEDVNGKKLEISRLKEDRKQVAEERDRLRDILSKIPAEIREEADVKMRKERNTEI